MKAYKIKKIVVVEDKEVNAIWLRMYVENSVGVTRIVSNGMHMNDWEDFKNEMMVSFGVKEIKEIEGKTVIMDLKGDQ